jgi:plastocyanin
VPDRASAIGRVTAAHIIRRPVPRPALVTALCACLLAGCGDDDDEGRSGRTVTIPAGKELRVVGRDYSFDPANVVVTGGRTRLRVTLVNEGALAHNLKLFQGDRELGGSPTFPGGESRSGTVELAPGSYRMVCTVGNHEELGMVGNLEVTR